MLQIVCMQPSLAQAQDKNSSRRPDRQIIVHIQNLLTRQGLLSGATPGKHDDRTRKAILNWQRARSLPETGEPSHELYMLMVARLNQDNRAAPNLAPSTTQTFTAAEKGFPVLAGTKWLFRERDNRSFTLILREDGSVLGTSYDRYWRWRRFSSSVQLLFDNHFGGIVWREGTLAGPYRIDGAARSSDGGRWSWTADRLDRP